MKKVVITVMITALLAAVGLQVYISFQPTPPPSLEAPLAEVIPSTVEGWKVTDLPMAASAEMQNRVEDTLQYDDAIFRMYERQGIQIGVYVAYWQAGKVSISKAGTHTPDTCWVVNGWEQGERKSGVCMPLMDTELKPGEWGIFTKDNTPQYVLFWHLVGGTPYGYEQYGWDRNVFDKIKRHLLFLRDARIFGLNQRREQFFIRVSSNIPFNEVWEIEGFQDIMAGIAKLGLFPDNQISL